MLNIKWHVPQNIGFAITTRQGGVSKVPFDSLNLGMHVGDLAEDVQHNRDLAEKKHHMPSSPIWLEQVHGTNIIDLEQTHLKENHTFIADGSYSNQIGNVCTVMTADCLPLLLCNKQGTEVAAVHAGWRGLCNGVIESALKKFNVNANDILALIGPCIGPQAFEVGPEVRQEFMNFSQQSQGAFIAKENNKYLANLPLLAEQRLANFGVNEITHTNLCTFSNSELFFSYRKTPITGRMASFIWLS